MQSQLGLSKGPVILKESTLKFNTIPEIPVYRPTWEEFKDFSRCVSQIEALGAHHMGLCKVIAPPEWNPRRNGYEDINQLLVEKPICQTTIGSRGIFFQDILVKKSMCFRDFKALALSSPYSTPRHRDFDHLEKKYWSSISFCRPLYGANVSGSLMDTDLAVWNIAHLESILGQTFSAEGIEIPGVNTPYLYYGMWRSTFPWHVEDVELYSINYLHFGYPKFWYVIPPAFARKFEAFVFECFRSEFLNCHCFLRHKCVLINPKVLANAGIPTRKIVQHPGEFIINFPYAYHAGFNIGLNIAESTNFALPRWIEYGKKAKFCTCWDDTVKISMDPFVRYYQPHLYDQWKKGIDTVPHPLDDYTNFQNMSAKQLPAPQMSPIPAKVSQKSKSNTKLGEMFLSNSMLDPLLNPDVRPGDLNLIDLRYSNEKFRRAKLPFHLQQNPNLQKLWCAQPYDEQTERNFNQLIGSHKPFCAICCFLWTPQYFAKIISGSPPNFQLPKEPTEPYIPELAYSNPFDSLSTLKLPSEVRSPILQCFRCCLTVHARCYGIQNLPNASNSSDFPVVSVTPTKSGKMSTTSRIKQLSSPSTVWHCDACRAPVRPSCVFCYCRGGALKALANRPNQHTGRPYWAHLVCALTSPNCYFIDIAQRLALIDSEAIQLALESTVTRLDPVRKHTKFQTRSNSEHHLPDQIPMNCPTSKLVDRSNRSYADLKQKKFKLCHVRKRRKTGAELSCSSALIKEFSDWADIQLGPSSLSSPTPALLRSDAPTIRPGRSNPEPQIWDNPRPKISSSIQSQSISPLRLRSRQSSTVTNAKSGPVGKTSSYVHSSRSCCIICRLPGRGNLPLASCWFDKCQSHFHVTCAQLAGIMIGTDVYPRLFFIACDRHPTDFGQPHQYDSDPVFPGDEIMIREGSNIPIFLPAIALRPITPLYCRITFPDGTFSADTPPEYLTNVDWVKDGPPAKGSTVTVLWDDDVEYVGTFQGTTSEKWEIQLGTGEITILPRESFYVQPRTQPSENVAENSVDHETLPRTPTRSVRHEHKALPSTSVASQG